MGSFEIIEHTADVGIAARADTLGELFEQAALGLADISGTWVPNTPEIKIDVELVAPDLGALMVDWLNELMYLQEIHDAAYCAFEVGTVAEGSLRARVGLSRSTGETGTAVKAATWHGLVVEQRADGWFTRVYVDV